MALVLLIAAVVTSLNGGRENMTESTKCWIRDVLARVRGRSRCRSDEEVNRKRAIQSEPVQTIFNHMASESRLYGLTFQHYDPRTTLD